MKFLHISDLHLGKKFYGISFLPYQKILLDKILDFINENKINSVIIAGDVYDKPVPPTDAIMLFDSFLEKLADINISVFIISGNHDSPERLQFGSSFMKNKNIYVSCILNSTIQKISLKDDYGNINVYMLPFFKCSTANSIMPEKNFSVLSSAIKEILNGITINKNERNILIYHGFVISGCKSPETSDSELGGVQLIDADLFNAFDYVALGHIHKPQWIKKDKIRYSGSLMKYSFSEFNHKKSLTVIDFKEKNSLTIDTIPLECDCDMRILKGSFEDIIKNAEYSEHFIRAELTDIDKIPFAVEELRRYYPNILELIYLNECKSIIPENTEAHKIENISLFEMMQSFYKDIYDYDLNETNEEYHVMKKICRKAEIKS